MPTIMKKYDRIIISWVLCLLQHHHHLQPGEENVLNTSDGKVAFKPNKLKNATQAYSFDHVFDSSEAIGASQKDIFDRIGKKVSQNNQSPSSFFSSHVQFEYIFGTEFFLSVR